MTHVFVSILLHTAISKVFQRFYCTFRYRSFCITSRVNFDFLVRRKLSKLTTEQCSLINPYFRWHTIFTQLFFKATTASVEYFDFIGCTRTKQEKTSTHTNKYFTRLLVSDNLSLGARSRHQISLIRLAIAGNL